jgi:2'-5' RNA ligase
MQGPRNMEKLPLHHAWVALVLSVAIVATLAPALAADQVTAIDVLLEPDATMLEHAEAANVRLRENYPEGFALDESHRPHITVLQRYVKTDDLDKIYAALEKALAEEHPGSWQLKAYKYYYIPTEPLGLAGIVIEPTADLVRFQEKVIDAVAPFTVASGTAAAFVTTPEDPDVNQPTIDYVATYVPDQVGEKFNPHVTIGLANEDYLKEMLNEKFDAFTFQVRGLSVYQLGNFGAARKKLKGWEFER